MTIEQKNYALLKSINGRLTRIESRMVQLMLKFGIPPKGAIPDSQRARKQKDDNVST